MTDEPIDISRGRHLKDRREKIRLIDKMMEAFLPESLFEGEEAVNQSPTTGEIIEREDLKQTLIDFLLGNENQVEQARQKLAEMSKIFPSKSSGENNEIIEGLKRGVSRAEKIFDRFDNRKYTEALIIGELGEIVPFESPKAKK